LKRRYPAVGSGRRDFAADSHPKTPAATLARIRPFLYRPPLIQEFQAAARALNARR